MKKHLAARISFASATLLLIFGPTQIVGQQVGPERGSLMIVGGALRDPAIVQRFIDLAGGPTAEIVVFPTAGGAEHYDEFWPGLKMFRDLGATNLTVLHTNDRAVADSDAFVEALKSAGGVWFGGGRQWRIADSYLGTKTETELWAVLNRGGVIGGSSAGATIQGSYLARGDTRNNTTMMGDHTEGFGFVKNVAIDQHVLVRNRQFDLIEIIEAHPELLGIGIDENTAIVVQGDRFTVMGAGYVLIYDIEKMIGDRGLFYLMRPGDGFDLNTREATRAARRPQPVAPVQERRWPSGGN